MAGAGEGVLQLRELVLLGEQAKEGGDDDSEAGVETGDEAGVDTDALVRP